MTNMNYMESQELFAEQNPIRPLFPGEAMQDDYSDAGFEESPEIAPAAASAAAAWAGLGLKLATGAITTLKEGDLKVVRPNRQIGVMMPSKPDLNYDNKRTSKLIINYRKTSPVGIEQVRVKMRCRISYNGPEVLASFGFDAGGKRSRLMRDTEIIINNPLPLKTIPAPEGWKRIGIKRFPVIEIPIEFRVDHPWPQSNREETFSLVLSGIRGFGAPGLNWRIRRDIVRN